MISLDLDAYITVVLEEYAERDAVVASHNTVEFEDEQISLEVGEGIEKEGWLLTAIDPPCFERRQVESFNPGKVLPRCRLQLKYFGSNQPPDEFEHRLVMTGAKKPKNFVTILSELIAPVTASRSLRIRKRQKASFTDTTGKHKLVEDSHAQASSSSSFAPAKKIKTEATTGGLEVSTLQHHESLPLLPAVHGPQSSTPCSPYPPPISFPQPLDDPRTAQASSYNLLSCNVVFNQAGSSTPSQQLHTPQHPTGDRAISLSDCLNRLPEEARETTPSQRDFAEIACELNDWKYLCNFMGISVADQTAIDRDQDTTDSKRMAVLELWQRRRGGAATFAELVRAAHQARDLALVEKVVQVAKHCLQPVAQSISFV